MIFKKLYWTFRRHPFLYRSRFKLLSKNSDSDEIEAYTYNDTNNKSDIPQYFFEINKLIFLGGTPEADIAKIKCITEWLVINIKGGPGLSVASEDALRMMLSGKGGVCSDMAQVFNNFCVINDILVREWGSTRAPYEEAYGGHSYNEVFIKELEQWVLVDVSYGILFYHQEKLLSVIELYNQSRSGKPIQYHSFIDSEHANDETVERNFLNPNTVPFLIVGYKNVIYDKFLKRFRALLPVFVIHFMVFISGKSYHYKFPLDDYKHILA